MSDIDLIAGLLGAVVLLWARPRLEIPASARAPESDPVAYLTRLISQQIAAPDLATAVSRVGPIANAAEVAASLESLLTFAQRTGAPVGSPLVFLQQRLEQRIELRAKWREKVAAAYTSAALLAGLPPAIWLLNQSAGRDCFGLLHTPVGVACLLIYIGGTAASLVILRRLRQRALGNPVANRASALSANQAAFLTATSLLIWRLDFFGFVGAVLVGLFVRLKWHSWLTASAVTQDRLKGESRAWIASVLASGLAAGLSWQRAVVEAIAVCDPEFEELNLVAQRLAWGVEPAVAFSDLAQWRQVCSVVADSAVSGAPLANGLNRLAEHWQLAAHQFRLSVVEGVAARAVLPVSLLQLPAFIAGGLVPTLWISLTPLLAPLLSTMN